MRATHLGPIWYHLKTFRCPQCPKPVSWLGLFCCFLQQTGSNISRESNQDFFFLNFIYIRDFQATEGRNAALICRAPRLTQLFPKGNCMIFFLDTCSFLKRAIITKLANWLLRFRQYPVWYLQIWLVGWFGIQGLPHLRNFC